MMDGIIKYQLDLIFLSTIVTFLFAIGSIIYSVKYKKYDEVKGAKLLQISIIVAVIIFVLNLLTLFGLR